LRKTIRTFEIPDPHPSQSLARLRPSNASGSSNRLESGDQLQFPGRLVVCANPVHQGSRRHTSSWHSDSSIAKEQDKLRDCSQNLSKRSSTAFAIAIVRSSAPQLNCARRRQTRPLNTSVHFRGLPRNVSAKFGPRTGRRIIAAFTALSIPDERIFQP
jgi:hypothetical protein